MRVLWRQMTAAEIAVTLRVNRFSRVRPVSSLFRIVSRLGDGVAWYAAFAVMLVVGGRGAIGPVLQTAATALLGVLLYRWLKESLVRERPFVTHGSIRCATPPLDRYSFPSGHTLHAALLSVFFLVYLPALGIALLPFALLVAASRVVLGLHYPTDVAAGAVIGTLLAVGSLAIHRFPPVLL